MKLGIIGSGYVGLVTGTCFAEMGNTVICVDTDARKIEGLKQGRLPIYEPGLEPLVLSNTREGRLRFTTSIAEAVAEANLHFIAVGTPPGEDGSADLKYVLEAARELGRLITQDSVIVDKSTVPVGTAEKVRAAAQEEIDRRGVSARVDVVSNPEFLKEGAAVKDFMGPERVVVGTDSDAAAEVMRTLYAPFTRNHERLIRMGVRDAEMTKYAANAMLATRISFMNEVANLCEKLGVDVENVRRGIGSDSRIGYSFIYPGCGYGGSCFPKDVKALIHMADASGLAPGILQAVEERNRAQKERLYEKIRERFGDDLQGKNFGVWGLAFKPGTDDMREAPAVVLVERLLDAGANVRAYDPVAMDSARMAVPERWIASGHFTLVANQYDALGGAHAMALVTEWKPFRLPDFALMKRIMKHPVVFDGRNQYDPKHAKAEGFEYYGIGR
ncbi:MAG TPA: UDP-glucose/GDP-mannose dehydrogenase family protein [Burkholderiales bacterium]